MTIFLRMPEHGRPLQPVQSLPWSTARPISVSEPPVFIARGMTGGGGGEPVFIVRGVGRGRSEDFDRVATKLT